MKTGGLEERYEQRRGIRDVEIRKFDKALLEILGEEDLPPAVTGDLSDLLGTLERGVALLTSFMNGQWPIDEAPSMFTELEVLVADELPMIIRDLAPALAVARERAYARLESKGGIRKVEQRPCLSAGRLQDREARANGVTIRVIGVP